MIKKSKQLNKGFTLFIAIVVMGTLLLVATGVVSLAVRQAVISSFSRESQHAFYAADLGIECALYWDIQNPTGYSAFSTSTGSTIHCNRDAENPENEWVVGGSYESVIDHISFLPDPYCTVVTVTKTDDGQTVIESLGYNTCDDSNSRRVERAVRASYGGGAGGGSSWTFCANEDQTCSFSGTRLVRYGANGFYYYLQATGSIGCNNATFGDPIVGTVKQCHYSS